MDLKKFVGEAGTFLNRAKQYTEEKLGQAEKTEMDAHFENMMQRAEHTRVFTEKILSATEAVLQPNPTQRLESYFYEKMDKKKREMQTNTEYLGQSMIDGGNAIGPGTPYGSALVKCGVTEQKLASAEKEFLHAGANHFLQPLKAFLEGDMKTIQKEKRVLENKRLDLDATKTRLRRAKSFQSKDTAQDEIIAKAEAELRIAQSEYDRQSEILKLLLEGISNSHSHHHRCLHDLIEAQSSYYAKCQQHMVELQRQLGSYQANPDAPMDIGADGMGNFHEDQF
jgi:endophilin-B